MGARMRESSTTDDYRAALSGEGDFGSLGYDWSDKPHRLVYDLCGEVDLLRSRIAELEAALKPFTTVRIERAVPEIEASDPWPDDRHLVGYDGWNLTVGMVRRAREALKA